MRDTTVLDRCISAEHTEVSRVIHEARAADEAELQLGLDAAALERPWEIFSIPSRSPIVGGAIHREHPFPAAATSSMLSKRPSVLDMLQTNRAIGLPWTCGPGTTQNESQIDALLPVVQPVIHNIGTGSLLRERFVIPDSNSGSSDERPKRTRLLSDTVEEETHTITTPVIQDSDGTMLESKESVSTDTMNESAMELPGEYVMVHDLEAIMEESAIIEEAERESSVTGRQTVTDS